MANLAADRRASVVSWCAGSIDAHADYVDYQLSGTAEKPIIFLCHSLGGIIVKRASWPLITASQTQANQLTWFQQALSYAQTRTGHKISHDYNIFSCTHSILFFGTPHHGSSKANWLDYAMRLGRAATLGQHSRKSDLVSALQKESETLQNITDYFVPLMRHFRIYFFWEQLRTDLGPLGRDYVVPHASAAPLHDETERAAIAADHRGLVRFEAPTEQGFRMVVDALVRYCAEAGDVVQQRREDAARVLEIAWSAEAAEKLRSANVSVLGFESRDDAPLSVASRKDSTVLNFKT